ncbi:MAG: hypothetical protein Rubg2KO_15340 [Rubricoccaceae bacterium]
MPYPDHEYEDPLMDYPPFPADFAEGSTDAELQPDAPPDEPAPAPTSALRPLADILRELHTRVEPRYLKSKTLQGNKITFIPWYRAVKLVERATRGRWEYEVTHREVIDTIEKKGKGRDAKTGPGKALLITVAVTIHGSDGSLRREGTGIETMPVSGYGDVQSNAESMAKRRALATFGLGLHLYEGED